MAVNLVRSVQGWKQNCGNPCELEYFRARSERARQSFKMRILNQSRVIAEAIILAPFTSPFLRQKENQQNPVPCLVYLRDPYIEPS